MTPSNGDTTATSADPETGAEGDTNQLEQEDTLLDRGVDSVLDEGYSPPDRPRRHLLETDLEQALGETLDERLAQEEPEIWETVDDPHAGMDEPDRAGRLSPADTEATGESASSLFARDVGRGGGAASAEEAAMHVIEEDDLV